MFDYLLDRMSHRLLFSPPPPPAPTFMTALPSLRARQHPGGSRVVATEPDPNQDGTLSSGSACRFSNCTVQTEPLLEEGLEIGQELNRTEHQGRGGGGGDKMEHREMKEV